MRRLGMLALLLALSLLSARVQAADAPAERIAAAVERAYRPLLKAHDVPGIAVVVTWGGQSAFFPFGLAAREEELGPAAAGSVLGRGAARSYGTKMD